MNETDDKRRVETRVEDAHHRLVYTNNPSTNPDIHDVCDVLQTPQFS